MTVLESIRCPGCSTRYVLGRARVRPGLRRARCLRCDAVFGIEQEVARLLAEPVEPEQANPEPVEPEQASPEPVEAVAPAAPNDADLPSLTLEDLMGVQDEAPDPAQGALEEPAAPAEAGEEPGRFVSARDAIEKLMGAAAAPAAPAASARLGNRGESMDVEATLDALETSLGGGTAKAPEEPEAAPGKPDLSSTVKLTSEEIKVAMAAMGSPAIQAAPVHPEPQPRPAPPFIAPEPPGQGPDLLKVQLEQETCSNVTIEQLTSWVEQGRVQEYHLVARQFSEHWIEAGKVPALRPVFERLRRERSAPAESAAAPAPEPPPVKRGLFAGLFGRN